MSNASFEEQLAEGAYVLGSRNDEISVHLADAKSRNARLSMRTRYIAVRAKLAAEAKRWDHLSVYIAVTCTLPLILIHNPKDLLTRVLLSGFFIMALYGLSLSRKATRFRKRAQRMEARFGHLTR